MCGLKSETVAARTDARQTAGPACANHGPGSFIPPLRFPTRQNPAICRGSRGLVGVRLPVMMSPAFIGCCGWLEVYPLAVNPCGLALRLARASHVLASPARLVHISTPAFLRLASWTAPSPAPERELESTSRSENFRQCWHHFRLRASPQFSRTSTDVQTGNILPWPYEAGKRHSEGTAA